jgi:preprotein translocase subunit SecG
MQTLLILVELFVSIGLIVVIMLQRSEGGALGQGGGGGMGGLFSPRGAADTLTRTTGVLALLFFVTCMALTLISLRGRDERSIVDTSAPATTSAPAPKAPAPAKAPANPLPR